MEFCVELPSQEGQKTAADTRSGRGVISGTEKAQTVCPLQTENSRQEWRTMWIWQAYALELFTFPAEPPWMGWGQQAGVLRSRSWALCLHNCQHPQSLYPLGQKKQGWKEEGRPGGQCCFFFSLVESIESDNKLNYFSPSQVCSDHDGNQQRNLLQYISPWAFPVYFVTCPAEEGWWSSWVGIQDQSTTVTAPVLQPEAHCNLTQETCSIWALF